jgi:cell wall-associated NlpC family hydrolase
MRKIPLFLAASFFLLAGCVTVQPAQPGESESPLEKSGNRPSEQGQQVTKKAAEYLRTPYRSPPDVPKSFDCSSFVKYVYAQFGYNLPAATAAYGDVGTRIDWKDALPGDILVFANVKGSSKIDHVAILWKKSANGELAGSWVIHAASINTGTSMKEGDPNTKTGIVITELGLRGDGIKENEYFYQRYMYCTRVLK